MTDDIRMIDDAGRPTVCRNHPASNEVEMLDADGRPRIKFVLNEVATLEGQALKLGGRVYQVSESGSTAEEVAQWVSRVRQRCPVDSGRKPGGSPIALPCLLVAVFEDRRPAVFIAFDWTLHAARSREQQHDRSDRYSYPNHSDTLL